MSAIRPEMIQVIAQTLDLNTLDNDSLDELVPEIELRVRQIIQDALQFQSHSKRRMLTTKDINNALQARHIEPLYGFQPAISNSQAPKFQTCHGDPNLYFYRNTEHNLQDLLENVLPPIPRSAYIRMHWLAIDGIQPQIPENEDDIHLQPDSIASTDLTSPNGMLKHVLTEEMRLYYAKLTKAIKQDSDSDSQRAAFKSLGFNPSIRQLLPYISRFVYEEVKQSKGNLARMVSIFRVCNCLCMNPYMQIELYLHQLLPALLTCVLSKELCRNPAEDHWTLRDKAAQLIASLCKRFGDTYERLQARVSQTYNLAISDSEAPFPTQYGAIQGVLYLGPLVTEKILLPKLSLYTKRLDPAVALCNVNVVERLEALHCMGAVVQACGVYLRSQSRAEEAGTADMLVHEFGEKLVPYMSIALCHRFPHEGECLLAFASVVGSIALLLYRNTPNNEATEGTQHLRFFY